MDHSLYVDGLGQKRCLPSPAFFPPPPLLSSEVLLAKPCNIQVAVGHNEGLLRTGNVKSTLEFTLIALSLLGWWTSGTFYQGNSTDHNSGFFNLKNRTYATDFHGFQVRKYR